jgi:hypothetical protein
VRFKKATKFQVESLEGQSDGHVISIWQYAKTVMIEVDGAPVQVNRAKLKAFLQRKTK